ncbi:MAG: hypothetical protein ACRC31_00790, partial [Cetobacterium sp.]
KFFVSDQEEQIYSRTYTQDQLLSTNISSYGILISTDTSKNKKNFYALLSSVSPEQNITFYQNP